MEDLLVPAGDTIPNSKFGDLSQQAVLDFIVDEVIIAEQLATRC
jgi:hypothetical protein